jgi:ABC-type sulfate transport system permease subunit
MTTFWRWFLIWGAIGTALVVFMNWPATIKFGTIGMMGFPFCFAEWGPPDGRTHFSLSWFCADVAIDVAFVVAIASACALARVRHERKVK